MILQICLALAHLISPVKQRDLSRDNLEIYSAVLRFFRPAGGQIRWIDPRSGLSSTDPVQTLSSGALDSLVRRAGRHFEVLKPSLVTDQRSGGVVRLSPIVRYAADSARVAARYQHRTPYYTHPEIDLSFLVVKRKDKWVLIRQ